MQALKFKIQPINTESFGSTLSTGHSLTHCDWQISIQFLGFHIYFGGRNIYSSSLSEVTQGYFPGTPTILYPLLWEPHCTNVVQKVASIKQAVDCILFNIKHKNDKKALHFRSSWPGTWSARLKGEISLYVI